MSKNKWPPARLAVLQELVLQGLSRREIACAMNTPVRAVSAKLGCLGVCVPLDHPPPDHMHSYLLSDGVPPVPAHFPRYEDVTPAEARHIARGAPPSGRWSYTHDFSLTGNAAAVCLI